MELLELELTTLSLEICEAVPEVLVLGMTAGCLVVLAAGAFVSVFKALLSVVGR